MTSRRMLTVAMVTVVRGGLVDEVDLVIMRRAGERGRIRYVDEGRKRHAQEQSLVCVGCVCATQGQEGQWISRWFGG